jgi:Flp pilus assembly protein TadG
MVCPNDALKPARRSARRGVAAVEFAFVAIPFFFFMFACIEFGRMNTVRQTVNNAAYEGARKCIVPNATAAEGIEAAQSVLNAVGVRNASITVTPSTIAPTTTDVTVKVTAPLASNLWVSPVFLGGTSVASTCSLKVDWTVSTRQQ